MPDIEAIVAFASNLIRRFEGCRLQAYPDPATHADPWTIGYGATGPDIHRGVVWTQEQADQDRERRVRELVDQVVDSVHVPLETPAYAALVSLAYNIGEQRELHSTVLAELNAGRYNSAANHFTDWVRAAGQINAGLVSRRKEERFIFQQGIPGAVAA